MQIFSGVVEKGVGSGTQLGFPTANIPCSHVAAGIYAGRVRVREKTYPAAIYADTKRGLLEAHLIDFNGDLYGQPIAIELLTKLRDDMSFADENEARDTIAADVVAARAYCAVH